MRDNCKIINRISDDEKTVFIGPRKLSVGHPQDKTLRKLYLYTDADVEKIDQLIEYLLSINTTVAWTTEDKLYQAIDINTYCNKFYKNNLTFLSFRAITHNTGGKIEYERCNLCTILK